MQTGEAQGPSQSFSEETSTRLQKGELPRLTVFSTSSSSAHPSTSGASAEPITSSTPASSAQPSTTASAASGVLAAAAALPAALLHAASSGLAALAATYASGSEDEGDNHAAPPIDVEAVALIAEQQRVQELRAKWTQKVLKQQKGNIFEPITLSDTLIERGVGIWLDTCRRGSRNKMKSWGQHSMPSKRLHPLNLGARPIRL